jgi:lipopolysaccharide biosynthesis glycosyltransferase
VTTSTAPVTVITLADEAYALPLAVMVRSMLDTLAGDRALRLVVIDGGLTPPTRQRLLDSWHGSDAWPRTEIAYVPPRFGGAQGVPIWGRVVALTYERLAAADHVPAEHGRALFLDSDMLVLADVGRLADTDLGSAVVAAVPDPYIPRVSSVGGLLNYEALALPADASYFNAGVMVIDMARWRDGAVGAKALAFTRREAAFLQQYDQDSLNAVLAGRWMPLDPRWQVQPRVTNALGLPPAEDPFIIHFSGRLKPWLYRGRDRADEIFRTFVDRTAWRGTRPRRTVRALAMELYDSPARRLFYPIEQRILARGHPGWRRTSRPMGQDI